MLNPYPALYLAYPALYPAPPNGHSGHFWAILAGEALGARDLGHRGGTPLDLRLDTPLVTFKEGRFLAVWPRRTRFPWLECAGGENYTENLLLGCLVS